MPAGWRPRALLLDEPRGGKPEELNHVHVGRGCTWSALGRSDSIKAEYDLIKKEGLEAFDVLDNNSEWSVADPDSPLICVHDLALSL